MKISARPLSALGAALLLAGCNSDIRPGAAGAPIADANLLFSGSRLASLDSGRPGSLGTPTSVTGLTAGDTLVSIDRRPQNGFLYALGYNAMAGSLQLYVLHPETLAAVPVGSTGGFIAADGATAVSIGNASSGTRFEMDFNPGVDRLRVVSSLGENFRINPNTGAFVDGDLGGSAGSVAGVNMDGALNVTGMGVGGQGTAYTNSRPSTLTTTQYTVDSSGTALYLQNPPNAGTLGSALALMPAAGTVLGLDIAPDVTSAAANTPVASGSATLAYRPAGTTVEYLASLDLTTGMLSGIQAVGSGGILGLALQRPTAIPVIALGTDGTLMRFTSAAPATATIITVTGLTAGETLVGIDYRPAAGQLVGLGIDAGTDTATLYRLDPQTGAATVIGSAGGIAFVNGGGTAVDLPVAATGYGFNFNPAVDRLRVTTGSGLNFRLNPVTGAAVDGDNGGAAGSVSGLNPDGGTSGATTAAAGAAYTNSVAGTAITTLYTLDAGSGALHLQAPPNAGTQTAPVPVLQGGTPLGFVAPYGFDIEAKVRAGASNAAVGSGQAHAALTVAGVTSLYQIDLVSGVAVMLGPIGSGTTTVAGIALGITHAE